MRHLVWISAALLLGATMGCEEEEIEEPLETAAEPAELPAVPAPDEPVEPVEEPEVVAIEAIAVAVTDYIGVPVEGEARVGELISDRGFWLEAGEGRVLGVVREVEEENIDIDTGTRLRFEGVVLSKSAIDDLAGELDEETRAAIMREPAFVAMHWRDATVLE